MFTDSSSQTLFIRVIILHLLSYVPLGPFMILNMWGNKKRSEKKRAKAANPRPISGLIWPITDNKSKARSTTKTNKAIWVASMANVNKSDADKASKERNWRFKYNK